ncbi:MAG: dehydrogenase, partial [Armatimonadota bacterium]|nr:dehydrogenase [Armatimonadota bacterium]
MRQKAKELLESGEVKVVIGYGNGSAPFKSTPIFVEKPEDASKLIWNPTCVNNLAVYLKDACKQGKVAIVVKPCDARSIIELIRENQIEREDVVILAVSCPGVLNLEALADGDLADVQSIEWRDNGIAVKTNSGEIFLPPEKAFADKCLACELSESPIADEKFGDPIERHPIQSKYASIEELEKLLPEERRAYWARQF